MQLFQRACLFPTNHLSLLISLSTLALTSLLGATPCLAATHVLSPTIPSESDPVLFANIFRQIGDAVRGATETVDSVDSLIEQITGGRSESPQPQSAPQSATPSASPVPATVQSPRPATSQSFSDTKTIHRDDSPSQCKIQRGSDSQSINCDAFQIVQADNLLIFSFYFDGAPVSFVADGEPLSQTGSAERFISAKGYMVIGRVIDSEYTDMIGSCVIGRMGNQLYQSALCTTEGGPSFNYTN